MSRAIIEITMSNSMRVNARRFIGADSNVSWPTGGVFRPGDILIVGYANLAGMGARDCGQPATADGLRGMGISSGAEREARQM